MAKKTQTKLSPISALVDPDIKSWIDAEAEASKLSQGWLVRKLLRLGFEELQRREGDSNPRLAASNG